MLKVTEIINAIYYLCDKSLKLPKVRLFHRDQMGVEFPINSLAVIETCKMPKSPSHFYLEIDEDNLAPWKKIIAEFQLSMFPTSYYESFISHEVATVYKYQKKGIGTLMLDLRCEMIRAIDGRSLSAAVAKTNASQIRLMKKFDFTSNNPAEVERLSGYNIKYDTLDYSSSIIFTKYF
jgi:hypothetical protein